MAQSAIREYDAKRLYSQYTNAPYSGILIETPSDAEGFSRTASGKFVIKPDQLFGKRGKYGLVWVNLSPAEVLAWWQERYDQEVVIGSQSGKLHTFLVEPLVPHDAEYYIAMGTERDHDVLYFSEAGGMEVEENWETVSEIRIPLTNDAQDILETEIRKMTDNEEIQQFLATLYDFFVHAGFVYLEVNPFVFDHAWHIHCLDMVARLDTTEAYRKKSLWGDLAFTNPFWAEKTDAEKYIDRLDSQTGASLKFRILNPEGRIWLLTSGGGASVIIADTLADLGYVDEIGNYGEASGNPDRENTRAYTDTLITSMLANGKKGQYIIIAGAIANFTHIDKTFAGIIDALRDHREALVEHDVRILVRRGGINDKKWLAMIREAATELGIPCSIASWDEYMTDILREIQLSA